MKFCKLELLQINQKLTLNSVPPLTLSVTPPQCAMCSIRSEGCALPSTTIFWWQPKETQACLESKDTKFKGKKGARERPCPSFLKSCIGSETCLYHFADNIERFVLESSCLSLAKLHRFIFL